MSEREPSVLIVNDDPDICDMISIILSSSGYRASAAGDGAQALERIAKEGPPSVILLDLMMPRMSGEQFIAAQRDNPKLSSIPVVLVSGDPSVREKADSLQVDGCLAKPVDLDELLYVVGKLVGKAS